MEREVNFRGNILSGLIVPIGTFLLKDGKKIILNGTEVGAFNGEEAIYYLLDDGQKKYLAMVITNGSVSILKIESPENRQLMYYRVDGQKYVRVKYIEMLNNGVRRGMSNESLVSLVEDGYFSCMENMAREINQKLLKKPR